MHCRARTENHRLVAKLCMGIPFAVAAFIILYRCHGVSLDVGNWSFGSRPWVITYVAYSFGASLINKLLFIPPVLCGLLLYQFPSSRLALGLSLLGAVGFTALTPLVLLLNVY